MDGTKVKMYKFPYIIFFPTVNTDVDKWILKQYGFLK